MLTFGEASGVEREGGILLDLVEVWDVGDMDSFESHFLLESDRERESFVGGDREGILEIVGRWRLEKGYLW